MKVQLMYESLNLDSYFLVSPNISNVTPRGHNHSLTVFASCALFRSRDKLHSSILAFYVKCSGVVALDISLIVL